MPRLLLLRHAKAEPARAGEKDHARVLSERGRREAAEVGRLLAQRGEHSFHVLVSTSARTVETWEIARASLEEVPYTRQLRSIFDAQADYVDLLRQEGRAASLLLVGHNPAIQETAISLADDLESKAGRRVRQHFPPAGLAILEFDGSWEELSPGAARLAVFIEPGEAGRD